MSGVRYQHRQWSWIPVPAVAIAIGAIGFAFVHEPNMPAWWWAVPIVVAIVTGTLSSLHISIDAHALHWHFGPGFWRRSIPLNHIVAIEITRTSIWNGWGIRYTRRGWLYNVAGFDAVMVTDRDGKSVLLGTDEPRRLASAIRSATHLR